MGKILALLSGKGGSGKTTLALSMASMMSEFGIKVLLIDCDLCTNGATFFYENKIAECEQDMLSFYRILLGNIDGSPVNINEYMDFIPSVIKITKENTSTYLYKPEDEEYIEAFEVRYAREYDVIIFDCQAGYTDMLRLILPWVDVNLAVMEPDAISSATIRGLYLKIGDFLNDRNIYQVFNKVTESEYKVYSKISGGTVFTNIETLIFDWKIRKAFSVSQIPDMENTSANYGAQIYNVCKVLFSNDAIQSRLKKYETVIEINKKKEEQVRLEEKIDDLVANPMLHREKREKTMQFVMTTLFAASACILVFLLSDTRVLLELSDQFIVVPIISMILCGMILAVINILDYHRERRNTNYLIREYRDNLNSVYFDLQKLKKKREMDLYDL